MRAEPDRYASGRAGKGPAPSTSQAPPPPATRSRTAGGENDASAQTHARVAATLPSLIAIADVGGDTVGAYGPTPRGAKRGPGHQGRGCGAPTSSRKGGTGLVLGPALVARMFGGCLSNFRHR